LTVIEPLDSVQIEPGGRPPILSGDFVADFDRFVEIVVG
jgi:hypothetical protein